MPNTTKSFLYSHTSAMIRDLKEHVTLQTYKLAKIEAYHEIGAETERPDVALEIDLSCAEVQPILDATSEYLNAFSHSEYVVTLTNW